MKIKDKDVINKGYKLMSKSNVVFCSIVRDCEKSLKNNIPIVDKLRSKFKNSQVIVFENDSKDNTKTILKKWSKESPNVHVTCKDYKEISIPTNEIEGTNKYFSKHRMSRMINYRNKYLELLDTLDFNYDYLIEIDLDIEQFYIDGIAHSFGLSNQWDVVAANCYSYSPTLKKRFHDTYALVEFGKGDIEQDEKTILENQKKWAFLKKNMPLIPVYAAFGGIAIYKSKTIGNKKYKLILNHGDRVEARNEHFTLQQQIQNEGYNRIFINPNMVVKYQTFSFNILKNFIKSKF